MAEEISPLENHGWWMEQLRKDAKANRPEALRLAHFIEAGQGDAKVVAELRRLVTENERLHAVNQELLEALKDALFHVANQGDIGVDQWLACERKARAAIAKAKGEKT